MCLPNHKSTLPLRLGLGLLAVTNILNFVIRKHHGDVDFITGVLFGASFGLLLLALWRDRGGRTAS